MSFNQPIIDLGALQQPRRQKGRAAPLPEFTFPTTGVTVQIKRLGPFTMDEIRKKLLKERKRPEPPVVENEIGDARVKMKSPNPHDPDYIAAVMEYETWLQTSAAEIMLKMMMTYSIVCDVDMDEVEDKRTMLAMIDPEANNELSDREVYIKHYLMATEKDLGMVQAFILGQSMPTEEAVAAHIDTFQGDVPREEPIRTPGEPIPL